MVIPNFYLEPANYTLDADDLHVVRNAVFVIEQNIPPEIEFDDCDCNCYHLLARDMQCRPIGTGRLSPDGKIGRMAVLREWRGQGVGGSLLGGLLDRARNLGLSHVTAHAQLAALGFYQRFGFAAEGEIFMEAGIPHQLARLTLHAAIKPTTRPEPKARSAAIGPKRLENLDAALQASLQLIGDSRRQLSIYSRDLDRALYAEPSVIEALKQYALNSRDASVNIIIQEPLNLRNQYHPLIELAQKLPSYFLIRAPLEAEDQGYLSAFMLNDRDGYLFRLLGDRYEGHWSPNLPWRSRQLREEFERVWQRSRPCSEFRALGL